MKAYLAYKESNVKWIGKIPITWEVLPLKHISIINRQALTEQIEDDYEIQYIDLPFDSKTGTFQDLRAPVYGGALEL